jgi:hypothetical protein
MKFSGRVAVREYVDVPRGNVIQLNHILLDNVSQGDQSTIASFPQALVLKIKSDGMKWVKTLSKLRPSAAGLATDTHPSPMDALNP